MSQISADPVNAVGGIFELKAALDERIRQLDNQPTVESVLGAALRDRTGRNVGPISMAELVDLMFDTRYAYRAGQVRARLLSEPKDSPARAVLERLAQEQTPQQVPIPERYRSPLKSGGFARLPGDQVRPDRPTLEGVGQDGGATAKPELRELRAAEVEWLKTLPSKPADTTEDQAHKLAMLRRAMPAGSIDADLVDARLAPVVRYHELLEARSDAEIRIAQNSSPIYDMGHNVFAAVSLPAMLRTELPELTETEAAARVKALVDQRWADVVATRTETIKGAKLELDVIGVELAKVAA